MSVSVDDRGLNHGPELVAQHDSDPVVDLNHVNRYELLLRIDPEQRSRIAGPAIFAKRARQGSIANAGADLEAKAKSQPGRAARPRQRVIRGHEFDRLVAEQALAGEIAAIGNHDRKPQVIIHGAGETAAAGFEARLLRDVEA